MTSDKQLNPAIWNSQEKQKNYFKIVGNKWLKGKSKGNSFQLEAAGNSTQPRANFQGSTVN